MVNLRGIVGQVLQPQAELISRLEDSLALHLLLVRYLLGIICMKFFPMLPPLVRGLEIV